MRINKGVEWAAHGCALLAVLPESWALSGEALAEYHGVPSAYMAKQLQALSRAGLVKAQRGAAGGYRLAKRPRRLRCGTSQRRWRAPSLRFAALKFGERSVRRKA